MKKVLVANRAEIACRVFQAAREMGLGTVGLVVPGDESARHVTFCDELVEIPSYLDIDAVLGAAKSSEADLIHPGYGFLSERPEFARAVEKAKLIFVGPRAESMEQMGSKVGAKAFAEELGVPTVPWAKVKSGDAKGLLKAGEKIGFPLLVKASSGGGGKGMRLVREAAELESAAESAVQEAKASFGEGTIFLEKKVEEPRHIEVQVFGDGKGGGFHLFERECSLQRRHQKVIEEAPAPRLKDETRQGLYEAALKLVAATQYRNAGTVEFLVDGDEAFYFLEMNTRLQVEHPVTEWIAGIDLVCAQLEFALSPSKPVSSFLSQPNGHAFEARLYAEDPSRSFMPTPGRVEKLIWPTGVGIRVDSGIEEGQEVTTGFDPMLAKITAWAGSRERALTRLSLALQETVVLGLGTNQDYLIEICSHPKVVSGRMDTGLLEREFGDYLPMPSESDLPILSTLERSQGEVRASSGASVSHPSPWYEVRV